MLSKSKIKLLQSLRQKKQRQKYHLFVAEGDKSITTMLDHAAFDIHQLYAISAWHEKYGTRVSPSKVMICTKEELKKVSSLKSSPEVIGVFAYEDRSYEEIASLRSAIYLDDVQDPGNVGTIIRIADWYGVEAVIRSKDSADFFNPKVVQSTMGSLGHVKLFTVDKSDIGRSLSDWSIVGAMMQTGSTDSSTASSTCLVVGNEGKGISHEMAAFLTHEIHIPGSEGRKADSLNAAISAGILAQHIWGQRL